MNMNNMGDFQEESLENDPGVRAAERLMTELAHLRTVRDVANTIQFEDREKIKLLEHDVQYHKSMAENSRLNMISLMRILVLVERPFLIVRITDDATHHIVYHIHSGMDMNKVCDEIWMVNGEIIFARTDEQSAKRSAVELNKELAVQKIQTYAKNHPDAKYLLVYPKAFGAHNGKIYHAPEIPLMQYSDMLHENVEVLGFATFDEASRTMSESLEITMADGWEDVFGE